MNIIKHGEVPAQRFECPYCRCLYECNGDEYEIDPHDNRIISQCPDCHHIVAKNGDD